MSLSHSSLPNEGFVKIAIGNGTKNVCWKSLGNSKNVVCRQLGYVKADSLIEKAVPSVSKVFSGSITCNDGDTKLSQCSIKDDSIQDCSQLSFIKCKFLEKEMTNECVEENNK